MNPFTVYLIGAALVAFVGVGLAYRDFETWNDVNLAMNSVVIALFVAGVWPAMLVVGAGLGVFYGLVRCVLFPLYGLLFDGFRAARKAFREAGS